MCHLVALLRGLAEELLHPGGHGEDGVGQLHEGGLLLGAEVQRVEHLLHRGLGVLQVTAHRHPDVLQIEITRPRRNIKNISTEKEM